MQSFIETINIFHYEQFWRLKGERQVSHKCGRVLTLIIFLFLGAITGYEMVLITKKTSITYKTQSQIDFSVSFTNLTTNLQDSSSYPFMAAIILMDLTSKQLVSTDLYNVTARYVTKMYNNSTSTYIFSSLLVPMEKCTPHHFARVSYSKENFYNIGITNWACIPLNKSFQIGGNIFVDDTKYLVVEIKCRDENPKCTNRTFTTQLLTLNTFVNPNNDTQPFLAYFNRRQLIFQANTGFRNFVYLDRNILKTDLSLTPISQFQIRQCFEETFYYAISQYFVLLSGKTIKYNREYLKILTALSFIGGLFTPIIGLISIMSKYGSLVYEMRFAKAFFKYKYQTNFNYLTFFTHILYKVFQFFGQQPKWQIAKRRDKLKHTVRTLLDVVYLQRRISFLEKSLTVLFDENQLKGLYLLHTSSKKEVDQIYYNYELRGKILKYYKQNISQNERASYNRKIDLSPFKQSYLKNTIISNFKQKTDILPNNYNLTEKNIKNQEKTLKSQIKDKNSKETYQLSSANNILKLCQLKDYRLSEDDSVQQLDYRDDYDLQFSQDLPPIQKDAVKVSIQQLNSLIAEARQSRADCKSKKIVSLLDQNIKKIIQKLCLQYK